MILKPVTSKLSWFHGVNSSSYNTPNIFLLFSFSFFFLPFFLFLTFLFFFFIFSLFSIIFPLFSFDEFPPLFCVFQQFCRCVAGTTVQSSYLFTAAVEEQLFDNFLSVFRGLVFLHSAFSLSHPDVTVVYNPLAVRLICIVDFSHISICESFCRIAVATDIRDSEREQDQ